MKEYSVPKSTLKLWQARIFLVFAALCLLTGWVWFLTLYFSIVIISAFALTAFFSYVYLPLFFKSYRVEVGQQAIIIKSGIVIKHSRIMTFPRLLYAEHIITPLARAFGVSALLLRATRASVFVFELNKSDIKEILAVFEGSDDECPGVNDND